MELQQRYALVTGATKGIGLAIAKKLQENNARIAICSRKRIKHGFDIEAICDVTKYSDISKLGNLLGKKFPRLDILVHNAGGISKFQKFVKINEKDYMDSYRLNFLSAALITKELLPLLHKSKDPRILFISSVYSLDPPPYGAQYSCAKSALNTMSIILTKELAPKFKINTLIVGPVQTDSWTRQAKRNAGKSKTSFQKILSANTRNAARRTLLGKIGMPEDIASMASFLLSKNSRWTTGSFISIDGGYLV